MKHKYRKLFGIIIVIILLAVIVSKIFDRSKLGSKLEHKYSMVTSFYPMYIIALNLADDIEELDVQSLTDFTVGCLHDYQLTTSDMRLLSNGDLFIMNGGGMENYLEDVIKNYPDMPMIDLSEGITMLESGLYHQEQTATREAHEDGDHVHEVHQDENHQDEADEQENHSHEEDSHDHSGHSHGEYNPHVWLDPALYLQQITNLEDGLIEYVQAIDDIDSDRKQEIIDKIRLNADNYKEQVSQIASELDSIITDYDPSKRSIDIIIFHETFAYLANRIGFNVVYTVELDDETPLSAAEVAKVIDIIKEKDIKYLFSEEQYGAKITEGIELETKAKTYMIDSAVTGDGTKSSYLDAMKRNIEGIKAALQ